MPDRKPTIDEIRARLANHTQCLAHMHYASDVAVLLEAYDALSECDLCRELREELSAGALALPADGG